MEEAALPRLPMGAATCEGQASSISCTVSSARFLKSKKAASAVTKIRKGNIDIRAESAMWLEIAQQTS